MRYCKMCNATIPESGGYLIKNLSTGTFLIACKDCVAPKIKGCLSQMWQQYATQKGLE